MTSSFAAPGERDSVPNPARGPSVLPYSPPITTPLTRGHACIQCQRQKRKCDGQTPCATCRKTGAECRRNDRSRSGPDGGTKRRRTASPRRVQQPQDGHDSSPAVTRSLDEALPEDISPDSPPTVRPIAHDDERPVNDPFRFRPDLLFIAPSTGSTTEHPLSPIQSFQLWQVYVDNVHPLTTLLHVPTTQRLILGASRKPETLKRSDAALLSATQLAAIESLSDRECEDMLGGPRAELLRTFCTTTQQNLARAEIMDRPDWVVLKALVLFLLAMRQHCDAQGMWLMAGVAVRCAQRLGLHREKTLLDMAVFEAELCRRLWWQIYLLNRHYTNLCSGVDAGDAAYAVLFDTRRPLNINDLDLDPGMTAYPLQRDGATETMFCSARYDIGDTVLQMSLQGDTVYDKAHVIQELEYRLNRKYLTYCDPSMPVQLLTIYLIKTALLRLKVVHCFPWKSSQGVLPETQGQFLFTCQELLRLQNSSWENKSLMRYSWHTKIFRCSEFLFPILRALAFDELPASTTDETWQQVVVAFQLIPDLLEGKDEAYGRSLGRLALKAWDRHRQRQEARGVEVTAPMFVEHFRAAHQGPQTRQASRAPSPCVTQPAGPHLETTATAAATFNPSGHVAQGLVGIEVPSQLDDVVQDSAEAWELWQSLIGAEDLFPCC